MLRNANDESWLVERVSQEVLTVEIGLKDYELSNHLGNVLAVVSDKKEQLNGVWQAIVLSAKDYYPFGMSMPGRGTEGGTYRYGFNGQERDIELGESVYTAEFWQYSANLGRRWNVDPKPNISISVYACFANNPICLSDSKGDTTRLYNTMEWIQNKITFYTAIR